MNDSVMIPVFTHGGGGGTRPLNLNTQFARAFCCNSDLPTRAHPVSLPSSLPSLPLNIAKTMLTQRSIALLRTPLSRNASSIAQKYSKATYQAALAKSPATLTKVHGELTSISSALKSTPDLASFIANPTLSAAERAAGLPAVYKAAGASVSDVTKNLFQVLSENGRLGEAEGVIEDFGSLVSKYKGELEVTVTSASPLPKDVQTKLEAALKQSQTAQQAKTVKVTNKVRRFCKHFS